jgi:hypothetical protein
MKCFLVVFSLFISILAHAQQTIAWNFSYNKETKVLELSADLADGWHLYSQHIANDVGPVPTSFQFEENKAIKLIGKVNEPTPTQEYDENFEAMLDFFEDQVVFTQRISVKKDTTVKGSVTFMMCNKTMCLPPSDQHFSIELTTD